MLNVHGFDYLIFGSGRITEWLPTLIKTMAEKQYPNKLKNKEQRQKKTVFVVFKKNRQTTKIVKNICNSLPR